MSRPALPAAELRRFAGSPRALLALFALVLVPLVYGGLYTWANESPTTRVDQIAAAVVNLDEPVTLKGADGKDQIVPLGRVVVGKLTSSDSASNFAWTLTDAATAESGLKTGTFGAVLTIPADFSRSATSTNGAPADARAARLSLRTDDAVNYLDGSIAKAIATTTSAEAARTVTEGYLSAMYAGYGTLHDQLSSAADGAGKLASGANDLTTGAGKAATGAGDLASGVDKIASGAGDLASGAGSLASGADQAATGLRQLSSGLSTIDSKVAALPVGTRSLADGAAQVSGGLSALATGAGQTSTGAAALSTGLTAYTSGVDGLAATCAASGASATFCANLSGLAAQSAGLRAGATGVSGGTAQLSGGLIQLVPGATQLAGGVDQLADGMPALADGLHQSATGAATLASKLPQLATGAHQIADGADQLASGAESAATGADQLTSGLTSLADGSAKLGSGATDLSTGLGEGVSKIPTYSESERATLAAVAAAPIVADVTRDNAVKNNGAGLAPYFMALALWVGSLAVYLLLRPLSPRALASGAPSPLVALAGYLPGALLGAAQGATLALVLQWWIGIGAASTWGLIGVGVLSGLTFVAMNQALVGLLGAPGRFVAVILAGLQLASAGGTYPVATAPGFFGWLHDVLPLTYAVDALRRVVAGATDGLGTDITALLLTLVGSLLVSMYAAHRQRTWTVRRLRPVTAI